MAAVRPARESTPATRSAAAAIASRVEMLQSHLAFVLDERVGPLNGDQRRFLDVAARHGRMLARLTEDLETLVLAEVGTLEPGWAPCDLSAIGEEALREVFPLAVVRCNHIELRAPEPVWVLGGESQLVRAAVEPLELAVSLASPETVLRAFVAPVALDVSYEGDPPAGGEVNLWLARAVAAAHGGEVGCQTEDGLVRLSLSLVRE